MAKSFFDRWIWGVFFVLFFGLFCFLRQSGYYSCECDLE